MPGWAVVGILLLSQVHLGRTDSFPCWRSCSVRKHSISSFHVHLRVIHTHILDFCSVWGSSCAPSLDHTSGQHQLQTPVSKFLRV